MRLLTTKRVRGIVKTASNRHSIEIKANKTRQYVWYSSIINTYGTNVRRIEYHISAPTRENLISFLDEIDTVFSLSDAPKTEIPYIYINNTVRFKIDAVIK